VTTIYTKNGRPLSRHGDDLFARSGAHVARLRRDKAFDSSGKYVGTLVNDRLIYRSTDSASIGSTFIKSARVGSANANAVGSALWGEEPPIPD
jgi:hypothetical protein